MKNYILKNSMLSLATIVVLGTTGCGGGDSSNTSTTDNTEIQTPTGTETPNENIIPAKTEILSGNVNLTDTTAKKSLAKSIARADALENFNCGTTAIVQLYAIDDTTYTTPLLKEAIEVNQTNCAFNINDTDFIDKNSSSSDNQYLIRTLIEDGDKTVELSATKLSEGVEVGVVDPIATLIKERFSVVITQVKESMSKLESLGVTTDSIATAVENIIADFEKNFDATVENLKQDIASGKINIDPTMFETTETLDTTVTEEQLKEREEKIKSVTQTFDKSSASTTFTMLESSMKKEQLDNVTITEDNLRTTLTPALAEIKYGVIESFVKIGLPVHDGQGNLIVYIPIEESRKGELPGKIYQLAYSTIDKKIEAIGNDFHIRVINPKTDLNQVNGNEDWYRDIQDNDIVIPSNVINAMMVAKDHTITMQDLGKALDKALGGDGSNDSFTTTAIYNTQMNDSVETSVENIVDVFKDDFVKQSFVDLLWEETDNIFNSFNGENQEQLVQDILAMPFIVQNNENQTEFLKRMGDNSDAMDFIVNQLESTLSNGIPVSDSNSSILQFKTGTTITPESAMKPLASLAMIDLFMQAKGSQEELNLKAVPLNDMFGWLVEDDNNTKFANVQIWSFDDKEETKDTTMDDLKNSDAVSGASEVRKSQSLPQDEPTVEEKVQESTNFVMTLIKVITGDETIKVERNFKEMNQNFAKTIEKIEMKSVDKFNFESVFRGDIAEFGEANTQATAVSFILNDFNNQTVILDENDTLILAPIFVNQETYERTTFTENNVTTLFNETTQRYEVDNIEIYNPETRFDASANVADDGQFISDNDFELILVKADGVKMPIATFPLFAIPNNDLDMPFYYDSQINYAIMPKFDMMDDEDSYTEDIPMGMLDPHNYNMFIEHQYLEVSSDVFFPQITTNNGEDVGENLFTYDIDTKLFTPTLTNGVVRDANMTITLLNRDYDDNGSNPIVVQSIDLKTDIKEGARLELELSGSQIKTQTIAMDILYIGENGEVEYELYKEEKSLTEEYYFPTIEVPLFGENGYEEYIKTPNTMDGLNPMGGYGDSSTSNSTEEKQELQKEDIKILNTNDDFTNSFTHTEQEEEYKEDMIFTGILPTEAGSLAGMDVNVEVFEGGYLEGIIGDNITIKGNIDENGDIKSEAFDDEGTIANCTGSIDSTTDIVTIDAIPTAEGSMPFSYTLEPKTVDISEENNSMMVVSEPVKDIDMTEAISVPNKNIFTSEESSPLEFTQDMISNKKLYLVTKWMNQNSIPTLSEVEYYSNGTRDYTTNGNTTLANYAIVDGNLEIYNDDASIRIIISILDKNVQKSITNVELFNIDGDLIGSRLIFETAEDRDKFLKEDYENTMQHNNSMSKIVDI